MPLVSVVIPCKNSSEYIGSAIKSVLIQSHTDIEIIVVDNNSTDDTKEIALQYTDLVFNKGPERSSQMNYGASIASGKYIFIVASDCELDPDVVKECVDLCERGADGVMVPLRHVGEGFWTAAKALERRCYDGDNDIESPWFIRKAAFDLVGGFDENLIAGEDWDIAYRLRQKGFSLVRNRSVMYHHLGRYNVCDVLKKNFYYGKNLVHYLTKKNENVGKQLPFLRRAYFRNWRMLISHPVLTAGFMFLKFVESAAVGAGIIYMKLEGEKSA